MTIAFDVSAAGNTLLHHYAYFINEESAPGNTKLRVTGVITATYCLTHPISHPGRLGTASVTKRTKKKINQVDCRVNGSKR